MSKEFKYKKKSNTEVEVTETITAVKDYALKELKARKSFLEDTKATILSNMDKEVVRLDNLINEVDAMITEAEAFGIVED